MGADMTMTAELAWENEGGRLRPAPPVGDTDTTDATREVATTDTAPS